MSPALLIGSLIAIFVVAAIARSAFPNRFRLEEGFLRQELTRVYPDLVTEEILIDAKGDAALVRLAGGRGLAAFRRLGDRAVVRHWMTGTTIAAVPTAEGLVLKADDFTEPAISFALDAEGRARAESWLALLAAPTGHVHAA